MKKYRVVGSLVAWGLFLVFIGGVGYSPTLIASAATTDPIPAGLELNAYPKEVQITEEELAPPLSKEYKQLGMQKVANLPGIAGFIGLKTDANGLWYGKTKIVNGNYTFDVKMFANTENLKFVDFASGTGNNEFVVIAKTDTNRVFKFYVASRTELPKTVNEITDSFYTSRISEILYPVKMKQVSVTTSNILGVDEEDNLWGIQIPIKELPPTYNVIGFKSSDPPRILLAGRKVKLLEKTLVVTTTNSVYWRGISKVEIFSDGKGIIGVHPTQSNAVMGIDGLGYYVSLDTGETIVVGRNSMNYFGYDNKIDGILSFENSIGSIGRIPAVYSKLKNVTSVASSGSGTNYVVSNGFLYVWGVNKFGEAGMGHTDPILTPTLNPYIKNIDKIFTNTYDKTFTQNDFTIIKDKSGKYYRMGLAGRVGESEYTLPFIKGVKTNVSAVSMFKPSWGDLPPVPIAGDWPPGLSYDTSTKTVSGTPTEVFYKKIGIVDKGGSVTSSKNFFVSDVEVEPAKVAKIENGVPVEIPSTPPPPPPPPATPTEHIEGMFTLNLKCVTGTICGIQNIEITPEVNSGGSLQFEASALPAGVMFDNKLGKFSGAITAPGKYKIEIKSSQSKNVLTLNLDVAQANSTGVGPSTPGGANNSPKQNTQPSTESPKEPQLLFHEKIVKPGEKIDIQLISEKDLKNITGARIINGGGGLTIDKNGRLSGIVPQFVGKLQLEVEVTRKDGGRTVYELVLINQDGKQAPPGNIGNPEKLKSEDVKPSLASTGSNALYLIFMSIGALVSGFVLKRSSINMVEATGRLQK